MGSAGCMYSPYEAISRPSYLRHQALGIHALHGMGIIHRDIKPENVFIVPGTSNAYVRIGDFTNAWLSSARNHSRTADRPQTLKNERVLGKGEQFREVRWYRTYTRKYIGTKEYLAPEVHRREWYGPMVDWWALGCLVWDLLVGDVSSVTFFPWGFFSNPWILLGSVPRRANNKLLHQVAARAKERTVVSHLPREFAD